MSADRWVLVPVEPTEAMEDAGERTLLVMKSPGATWAEQCGIIYRAMIAAAPAAPAAEPVGWISVDDRMPKPDSGEVLVYLSGGMFGLDEWHTHHEDPIGLSTTHTLDMGQMWRTFDYEDITHWMPLPAAPGATQAPAQSREPLTDAQVFASQDFMSANGLYWGLPMATSMQIVRCTERPHGIGSQP